MDIKAMLGQKKKIDPLDREAKLSAVKDMRKVAGDMMADGIKGKMEQVTVAAPDKSMLAAGLDKAKDLLAKHEEPSAEEDMETPEMENSEMEEEQESHGDALLEELDTPEKIAEFEQKLAEKKASLAKG